MTTTRRAGPPAGGAVLEARAIGQPLPRLEGTAKVTGTAPYAFEQPVAAPLYLYPVLSSVALGRITAIDTTTAAATPGVVAVLTHDNAPRLASDEDRELWVLQSDAVHFRGQIVGAVVAETSEIAREAAHAVAVAYDVQPADLLLSADRTDLYAPQIVNGGVETDTHAGDVAAAMATAAVTVDQTYSTPMEHNNPMETHTTVALWQTTDGTGQLTLYDANQGTAAIQDELASVFGIDPNRIRVISPHVGGGFGAKYRPRAHQVVAALAAQVVAGRPVKFALTRQQMFYYVGYRTPTIQRIQLGADAGGRLTAIAHDVVEQTSKIKEFAEQTAYGTHTMYAAPNRRTSHRLAALDVPVPGIMRAPGETPGMFALESAMDEMAVACGLDPIEFRRRNEPDRDPTSGLPYSTRNLLACLDQGAGEFGWIGRDPTPGVRRAGGWLVGTGVASSTYPIYPRADPSHARIRVFDGGRYRVEIQASDIGTGTWTSLTQIAADALGVPVDAVSLQIGDSSLPAATGAGGSMGIIEWGSAIADAARVLRDRFGPDPDDGAEAEGATPPDASLGKVSRHVFGAQFAEVRVDADTGELRVDRLRGIFAVGRVINPRTARSQLIGGMVMGLSMALHEYSVLDPRFGHVVNHDFAEYHIATNADVKDIDATWIDEIDLNYNPMGAKGIGEAGIVGTAAAIANAAYHATGVRVRDLPITPDKLLLPAG